MIDRRSHAILLVPLLFLVLGTTCSRSGSFRDLITQFRCGMTEGEAVEVLRQKGIGKLSEDAHPRLGNRVALIGRDNVWLNFEDQRLTSVAFVESFGLMGARESARYHLCSNLVTVGLTLETSADLQGASVYLDGRQVGTIGKWLFLEVQVPVGKHEIRISKPGYEDIVRGVNYSEADDGNPRLKVTTAG